MSSYFILLYLFSLQCSPLHLTPIPTYRILFSLLNSVQTYLVCASFPEHPYTQFSLLLPHPKDHSLGGRGLEGLLFCVPSIKLSVWYTVGA